MPEYTDPNTDPRNIIDEFKGMPSEVIRSKVQDRTLGFAIAMVNWSGDFNFSGLVRSANNFGAKHVFYVSEKRRWDKRGAQGTYNYTNVDWAGNDENNLFNLAKDFGYIPIAVEQSEKAISLYNFEMPLAPLFILGSESEGLTENMLNQIESHIVIPGVGSTRSLNAAVAGSVVMSFFHASKC